MGKKPLIWKLGTSWEINPKAIAMLSKTWKLTDLPETLRFKLEDLGESYLQIFESPAAMLKTITPRNHSFLKSSLLTQKNIRRFTLF